MPEVTPEEIDEVYESCLKFLTYHPTKTMKDWFLLLAEYVDPETKPEHYGTGKYLQEFEKEIATLFGKEAAVFMPSGTMAQQLALRIWADKTTNNKIAIHPTSHLEIAEHFGYEFLHHLQRIQFGNPNISSSRLLTQNDFDALKEIPGSVLLELPQRPIGGQLPDWDDLVATSKWCRDKNVKIHLDGARVWESTPYYKKTLAEIGELFDSVYVSFYKGLDGIAGSMLLGPQAFIDEAKIWQRRMGGNLPRMFPLYVAAKWGMEQNLPKMADYYEKSKQVAKVLNELEPLELFHTNPDIPHTNMFHLFIKGTKQQILKAHLEVAKETGIWLINGTQPSIIPAYQQTELVILSASLNLEIDEITSAFMSLASKLQSI